MVVMVLLVLFRLVDKLGILLAGVTFAVAVAVIALAELVDAQMLFGTMEQAEHAVERKARDNAHDHLRTQDSAHGGKGHLSREEDGNHLVGCGQKHSDERADRDDAARIERRRRRRKAALGHDAEHRANDGARLPRALDGVLRLVARLVLEPFHSQIGDEQKRDEVKCVFN